jgi:uncharacterized membrane protein YoaK (UPF0700 family)
VDAAGLSGASKLFVSFMSGNTTIGGLALAHGDWPRLVRVAEVLACFVGGVTAGEFLTIMVRRQAAALVLLAETACLMAGTALAWHPIPPDWLESLPLAVGMGLQNATMHSAGGLRIGLTYITGTLVQLGRSLAALLAGHGDGGNAGRFFAQWLALAIGACLCGLALAVSRPMALAIATGIALCLTGMIASLRPASAPHEGDLPGSSP